LCNLEDVSAISPGIDACKQDCITGGTVVAIGEGDAGCSRDDGINAGSAKRLSPIRIYYFAADEGIGLVGSNCDDLPVVTVIGGEGSTVYIKIADVGIYPGIPVLALVQQVNPAELCGIGINGADRNQIGVTKVHYVELGNRNIARTGAARNAGDSGKNVAGVN